MSMKASPLSIIVFTKDPGTLNPHFAEQGGWRGLHKPPGICHTLNSASDQCSLCGVAA